MSEGTQRTFLGTAGLLPLGCVLTASLFDVGWRVMGAGMLALAVWLLRYDVARRAVRQSGLTCFIATCLLSGYAWLGVSGGLALVFGGMMAGPRYDVVLHSVFLGSVMSMIFGHAPFILPAVAGFPLAYRPAFYAHLALLHASLALSVLGDLASRWPARQWGGMLNVFAVLLFVANTAYVVRRSVAEQPSSRTKPRKERPRVPR